MSAAPSGRFRSPPLRTDMERCTSPSSEIGSDLERAIALFREALPGFGLKLVVPPPLPDGTAGRLSLSVWRRGEQSTLVHAAANARDAVQRLFDAEIRRERQRRDRGACPLCGGNGWYVAVGGVRTICAHLQHSTGSG